MKQQEQLLDYQFPDTTDIERLVLKKVVDLRIFKHVLFLFCQLQQFNQFLAELTHV